MVNKDTVGNPFRRIRIPVEARQHLEEYRGIPVLDAFYTAGWVQEDDGTFQRYLSQTAHIQAIVLDGAAMSLYESGTKDCLRHLLLLTGNRMIESNPEIYRIVNSKEKGKIVEYGVDFIDSRIAAGILGAFDLIGEHGELPERDLKIYADKVREIVKSVKKIR